MIRGPRGSSRDAERSGGEGRWRRLARILGLASLAASLVGQAGPAGSQLPPPPVPVQLPGRLPQTPSQLDQLLAPIALYPDQLLGQVLMAATYPLEVVQAARWLQDPAHAALAGDALAAALDPQPWDPSVKALVPFPQVLRMMDASLEWTATVGDAFLADGAAVMDSIQRLRLRAQSAGSLASTPQLAVSTVGESIVIVPASPGVVYVPVYDPRMVYGAWIYSPYPYLLIPPPVSPWGPVTGGIGFSVGFVIVEPYWGWHDWDWPGRRIHLDIGHFSRLGGHPPPGGPTWRHDPDHRHGVPYRHPGPSARPPGDPVPGARGYAPGPGTGPPAPMGVPGSFGRSQGAAPAPRSAPPRSSGPIATPPGPGGVPRPLAPAFESFGRSVDVRTQTDRGKASRELILPPLRPTRGAPSSGTTRPAPSAPKGSTGSGTTRPGTGTLRR